MQIAAQTIARPLAEALSNQPFSGHVLGRFERAINLIDSRQRIVAVTTPDLGRGPFSIVIEATPSFFETVEIEQPVSSTARRLRIGPWVIDWAGAMVWEPKLPHLSRPFQLTSPILEILKPYQDWPGLATNTPAARCTARLALQAAQALNQALVTGNDLGPAVESLAGLGGGLTPAGDDYLVGVMAALWLRGESHLPPIIAGLAAPQTTALSAAFLTAAGRGQFSEPWQRLARSWSIGPVAAVRQSVAQIAAFGASSGRDALAGFTAALGRAVDQAKSQPLRAGLRS